MLLSEIGWVIIGMVALVWEMLGVFGEYKLWPLTTILRDRYMARYGLVRLGVFLFWAWLGGHFFLGIA